MYMYKYITMVRIDNEIYRTCFQYILINEGGAPVRNRFDLAYSKCRL